MKFTFFLFTLFASALLFAQEVTTLIPPTSPTSNQSFEAISWSKDGRIYSPDIINGRLYQINLDGTKTTLRSGLSAPLGGAFDEVGNFYYSEYNTGKVYRRTPAGVDSLMGIGFGGPTGILVDSAQTKIYVSDYNTRTVHMLDLTTGQRTVLARNGGLNGPDGIVYAPNGDLLVANFNDNKILRVKADGTVSLFTRLSGSPNSGYLVHFGDGYLSAGLGSHAIWYIDAAGITTRWAGTGILGNTDGPADMASFESPNGIAINPAGDTILVTSGAAGAGMRMITDFGTTAVPDRVDADRFALRLSPNPTSEMLSIDYQLQTTARVQVTLLSTDGRLLASITDTTQAPGTHQLNYNLPGHLPAGQYRCLLKVDGGAVSKAFVLNR